MCTYTKNCRVVRHLWWSRRLIFLWRLDYCEVLDIATAEHNVFVNLVARGDLIVWVSSSAFRTERSDFFQGDGRIGRIDFV